jgi:hypothetical protein
MKKFWIINVIVLLILFTALVKNSTKKKDDDIFAIQEKLQGLNKEFEDIKLEHDYLSSAEKLLEYKKLYFENELIQKDIKKIRIIKKNFSELVTEDLKISTTNE